MSEETPIELNAETSKTEEVKSEVKKPQSNLAALDDKDVAIANYILYLLGPTNGITAILGGGLALLKKSDKGTDFDNHFTYQIRSAIYGVILLLGMIVAWPIGLGKLYGFVIGVWWLLRAAIGLKYLLENKPLPNPETWLV